MNRTLFPVAALLAAALAFPAYAQKKYDPGASDTEIKIGNTNPYSGPASAYGAIGKSIAAYFRMLNERGGINGRKVRVISLDDGYSPPKTVELIRQLVEQEKVLCTHNTLGTATNTAIHKYMNAKKVPQLFVATGATKWNDPKGFHWTMGWQPNYQTEARIYAKHILQTKPNAKIAVLYQNDDYGKDYLKGFEDGLGAQAQKMIVAKASYEVSEPTVDSQILQLKSSGADVFFNITTPKFAAQAIRAAYDSGWKPTHYLNNVSNSVGSVLKPAGLEKAVGIITSAYVKDPTDKRWASDAGMKTWREFMAKYNPDGDTSDPFNVYGYTVAATLEQVLKQCGDTLTRENVMKQAASLKRFRVDTLLPGITISTSPNDYAPIEAMQLERFNGQQFELFGEVISNEQ
ncbi:MAG TPA: ABC transporter substrate-binding protein [Burkholderiales bacterium]|nr:ABC transporter substrate-binding protein [Burkholderiales bacterium]